MVYHLGETIKDFNLSFTKLYNQIPKLIIPHSQHVMIHFYNTLPPIYKNRLEEKDINNLGSTLQTYSEFEDQNLRTRLPLSELNKSV